MSWDMRNGNAKITNPLVNCQPVKRGMLTNVGYCYLWFVYGFLALTASKNGQMTS